MKNSEDISSWFKSGELREFYTRIRSQIFVGIRKKVQRLTAYHEKRDEADTSARVFPQLCKM